MKRSGARGLSMTSASGTAKHSTASSNETPCLRELFAAFAGRIRTSHLSVTHIMNLRVLLRTATRSASHVDARARPTWVSRSQSRCRGASRNRLSVAPGTPDPDQRYLPNQSRRSYVPRERAHARMSCGPVAGSRTRRPSISRPAASTNVPMPVFPRMTSARSCVFVRRRPAVSNQTTNHSHRATAHSPSPEHR